jgi:hypothetical protein
MRWFSIFFAAIVGLPFAVQIIKGLGQDEATIPIQFFGETYQRDENPTMYTVAVSLNYAVTFAVAAFIFYQAIQLMYSN